MRMLACSRKPRIHAIREHRSNDTRFITAVGKQPQRPKRARRRTQGTDADLAERKAAELAALKLVRNKLEEHVARFAVFDLDQNRSALVDCCPENAKTTRYANRPGR